MQFQQKLDHTSISQKIQNLLREQIVKQQIKPGTRLVEEDIARELGVSRTPVREALSALAQRGLVESHPRKGMYVIKLTKKDVDEIYEIREVLEGLVACHAAIQMPDNELQKLKAMQESAESAFSIGDLEHCIEIDTSLHDTIMCYSSNSRLVDLLESIHDQILIFRIWESKRPERVKLSLQEHKAIIEALCRRDPEMSRNSMIEHIKRVRIGLLENYPFENFNNQYEQESMSK